MSDQLTLPYQSRSVESREAAESVKPHLSKMQAIVLYAVARLGPITDNGLIDVLGGNASTIRPRRVELERKGHIYKSGTVRQSNGRNAAVWRVISPTSGPRP
jgi:hypothetical protein